MGIDAKYGKITAQFGSIGEDEPVVLFRAADKLLPKVMAYYHMLCMKEGSPRRHLDIIVRSFDLVKAWQAAHPDAIRVPSSANSKSWLGE